MIKPPVVYLVGVLRALGAPMKWYWHRRRADQHAAAPVPAAERRGLGGRHVVAQHEHGPGPLRRRRARAVPQVRQQREATRAPALVDVDGPAGETAAALVERAHASSRPRRGSSAGDARRAAGLRLRRRRPRRRPAAPAALLHRAGA